MVQAEPVDHSLHAEAQNEGHKPPAHSTNTVHLIRTAQVNTLALSQMADQKAHILVGASFVVFSLVITQGADRAISWSMMCLATTALLATICAVIAVLPRPGPKAIDPANCNHMFFAHFALMEEELWASEVLNHARTDEGLYRMMLRDLYQNGKVLQARKFRFLAYAYQTFLAGLALTLMIYLIEAATQLSTLGG